MSKHYLIPIVILFLLGTSWAQNAPTRTLKEIFSSLQARQAGIENILLANRAGEAADGYLVPNEASCTPEQKKLIEEENADRKGAYALMAEDLDVTADAMGRQRARRYMHQLVAGIRREVEMPDGTLVWMDRPPSEDQPNPGVPPVPRLLIRSEFATIYENPGEDQAKVKGNIRRFSAYSVLGTQSVNGTLWYEVSSITTPTAPPADWKPIALGWISEKEVIPWKHSLVMEFTSMYRRTPGLFFDSEPPLEQLIATDREKRASDLSAIEKEIEATKKAPEGSSVVAREPQVDPSSQPQAYLIPVLDFKDTEIDNLPAKLLQVVAKVNGSKTSKPPPPIVDVVFVMDTTGSMGPYLEGVVNSAQTFARELGSATVDLKFGFVAYRDDVKKYPFLSYTTKMVTPEPEDIGTFVKTVEGVRAIDHPTEDDIPEALFEGVETALLDYPWRENSLRVLIVAGDAPGHPPDDPGSLSNKDEVLLQRQAMDKNISIAALHIANSKYSKSYDHKTAETIDHDLVAKRQFQGLVRADASLGQTASQNMYLAVDARDTAKFEAQVLSQFRDLGQVLTRIWGGGFEPSDPNNPGQEPPSQFKLMLENAYVDWLRRQDTETPPDLIEGWISEKSLATPGRSVLIPKVLLTRSELTELSVRLKELLAAGRDTRSKSGDQAGLFERLSANSGWTLVDPSAPELKDAFKTPIGLERLPYKSRILTLSNDAWRAKSRDDIDQFFRDWERMLQRYSTLLRNVEVWKPLTEEAKSEDFVVGLELDMLP